MYRCLCGREGRRTRLVEDGRAWPGAGARGWGRRGGEMGTGMGTAPIPSSLTLPLLFYFCLLCADMLPGLLQGQEKMSKSDPNSAIFMEDEEADVNSKIKNHTVHRILTFTTFEELVSDYEKGDLHPADLKPALSKTLNRILQVC
ncbi:putative tyrosine--tRNA ligase [Helianthus debilis subsp. tardiflorus]